MSYDIKLRRRALEYWADGHTRKETSETFKVSAYALQAWKKQLNKTGELSPKKRRETWRKIEPSRLMEYIKQNPDAYLKEMAEEFCCSQNAISKALKRLKISRKKNDNLS